MPSHEGENDRVSETMRETTKVRETPSKEERDESDNMQVSGRDNE